MEQVFIYLYSGGTRFESRQGHWFSSAPLGKCLDSTFKRASSPIDHPTIGRYVVSRPVLTPSGSEGHVTCLFIFFCSKLCRGPAQLSLYNDWLDGPGLIPGSARFSLVHSVETDSGPHPASYPMATVGSFPGGGGVKLMTVPSSAMVKYGGAMPSLPHISSWRGG
jgi:hypothetical protein